MGSRAWGWAGWAALAVAALCGLGGAARTPGALLLALPPWPLALAVLAAAVGAAYRYPEEGLALRGLWVVPALWLLLPRSAAAGALSGPPVLALGAGALLLSWPEPSRLRRLFAPTVFLLYVVAAVRVQHRVGPQGDEPHYLMVADSLWRDGDVRLDEDYEEARYAAFFREGPLAPHFRVRGRGGEIYSLHALGLSLLVLPAYALGGYEAASLFMAVLGALAALAVRSLVRAASDEETGERVGWILGLSPPLLHYAGLIFTEVPAALVTAWTLREGLRAREIPTRRVALVGLALAFLPWLNVRYTIAAAVVGVFWLAARPGRRAAVALALPAIASAAALAAYHHALYGFFDPRRVYGKSREFALETLREGVPGLLVDQEFGLLVYAPVFVLAVPGLVLLVRQRSRIGVAASALVLAVGLTAASWHMWRGGFNPPARFLVPIVPALALGIASWIRGRRWLGAALLAGWSVWAGVLGALDPELVHRDRDVTAPLFRARSGALEWTRLLPSYVLAEPDRHRLAVVWGLVLVAAAVRRRPAGARSVALGLLVVAAAAETAVRLSDGRAAGRESTHALGRWAIEWPRAQVHRVAEARWTAADLEWGPVYEPHRHAGRVMLADRLRLRPGRYRLELVAEPLGGGEAASPVLHVVGRHGRQWGRVFCATPSACELSLSPGQEEISLILDGGSAFRLKEIHLFNLSGPRGSNSTEGTVGG